MREFSHFPTASRGRPSGTRTICPSVNCYSTLIDPTIQQFPCASGSSWIVGRLRGRAHPHRHARRPPREGRSSGILNQWNTFWRSIRDWQWHEASRFIAHKTNWNKSTNLCKLQWTCPSIWKGKCAVRSIDSLPWKIGIVQGPLRSRVGRVWNLDTIINTTWSWITSCSASQELLWIPNNSGGWTLQPPSLLPSRICSLSKDL